jgi:hypothetical protein
MALVQIPGTALFRDTESMALVNRDSQGLEEYNMKRRMILTQRDEINKVKTEISELKQDMTEIKQLLLKLMDKDLNG